jgi:exocyst complex component 4
MKRFRSQIAKTNMFFESHLPFQEDLEMNPEVIFYHLIPQADSFSFMHSIVEAFHILGKLPEALKTLHDRVSLELFYVIERTIQEVDSRHEEILTTVNTPIGTTPDLIGMHTQSKVLNDLLQSLYAKLDVVIQGHYFILHVAQKISGIAVENMYSIKDGVS